MPIATLDKLGRIVLPKPVRDRMQLRSGDVLDLVVDGNCIALHPRRPSPTMRRKGGVLVYDTGTMMTQEKSNSILRAIRNDREARFLGLGHREDQAD